MGLMRSAPTVIDLFSGAGGLGASFEAQGFRTVAAVDSERDCISTLKLNQCARLVAPDGKTHLQDARLICDDIRDIQRSDLVPADAPRGWRPDVLAGGPPCQPFSHAGLGLALRDPRGQLFRQFVRLADELNPKVILFENVAGLVTSKCAEGIPGGALLAVQHAFEEMGYACKFQLLNAADFGAPQRRIRLYMLATRDVALPEFPLQTHASKPIGDQTPWVRLASFLAQLPAPNEEDVVRPTGKRAFELEALTPGSGLRSEGIVEANRPSGHWGYRQDCYLADPNLPSRTIRAASTPDWVRVDEYGLRRLTWRECAALQSFPEGWLFAGTKASRFRQIGNAVQGNIGRAIAHAVSIGLADTRRELPQSEPWPAAFHRRVRYTAMESLVNGGHREAARLRRAVHPGAAIGR